MSLSKYPVLSQNVERVQKAREALSKGCFHLTYTRHRNACEAAKSLGGVCLPFNGKWAVVI
jgi:hypothetical protein